jgi:hypothetical protein
VCRLHRSDAAAVIHEAPAGCSWRLRPSGYGQWIATLETADRQAFEGFGWSDVQALSRARAAAVQAGVSL